MNELQILAITIMAPFALIALMFAVHSIPRLIPPYRQALRDAVARVPALTGRPIQCVDVVGRDNDRLFVRVAFADAKTFGTKAGPLRSYFVYSIAERTLGAIPLAAVRPHRFRSLWC